MSPLKISSEERAGEEWNISELIQPKILKQPEDYISYQNKKGNTSIRFMNYKERALDDLEATSSESNIEEDRRHSVCEFMEIVDIDNEIKHYEIKLKKASDEYNSSMICEWGKIREKEVYFLREIQRLKKLKREKELNIKNSEEKKVVTNIGIKRDVIKPISSITREKVASSQENSPSRRNTISEEEQWNMKNKLLLESYEEIQEKPNKENNAKEEEVNLDEERKDKEINEIYKETDNAKEYKEFIYSLGEDEQINLDNMMEAMEIGMSNSKRKKREYGDSSVKNEGERERPSRASGTWSPEKEDTSYNYIPGRYKYMG